MQKAENSKQGNKRNVDDKMYELIINIVRFIDKVDKQKSSDCQIVRHPTN